MNHAKIQTILDNDTKFGPIVACRDTKVVARSGVEVYYANLTVQVANAIGEVSTTDKACSRIVVLAYATRLSKSQPTSASANQAPPKKVAPIETIVVRPAPVEPTKLTSEKAQQKVQQADLAQFMARGDILKFQGSVAIGQLLAAVFQLAESDCWEGHERRKELLNELLESYEGISKRHVNFSVKQIIRVKTEEQLRNAQAAR